MERYGIPMADRLRGVALSDAVRSHTVKAPSKETRMLRIARRDKASREAFGGTVGARLAEAVKMPAKQASVQVRLALAKMPWVSPAMLAYLATDTDPSVRGTALREVGEHGLITNVTPAGAHAVEVAPVVVARDVPTI